MMSISSTITILGVAANKDFPIKDQIRTANISLNSALIGSPDLPESESYKVNAYVA